MQTLRALPAMLLAAAVMVMSGCAQQSPAPSPSPSPTPAPPPATGWAATCQPQSTPDTCYVDIEKLPPHDVMDPATAIHVSIAKQQSILFYTNGDDAFIVKLLPLKGNGKAPFYRAFPNPPAKRVGTGPAKDDAQDNWYKIKVKRQGKPDVDPHIIIGQ